MFNQNNIDKKRKKKMETVTNSYKRHIKFTDLDLLSICSIVRSTAMYSLQLYQIGYLIDSMRYCNMSQQQMTGIIDSTKEDTKKKPTVTSSTTASAQAQAETKRKPRHYTISIPTDTHRKLQALGRFGQAYNDIILELIDEHNNKKANTNK